MNLAQPVIQPIDLNFSLKDRIYDALKQAITSMTLYDAPGEPRLDERRLAGDLGVSRTPLREAIARLEQEGFVRTVPRKGVFVVRMNKQEILVMINFWAALERMAGGLFTLNDCVAELASLRKMFATLKDNQVQENID